MKIVPNIKPKIGTKLMWLDSDIIYVITKDMGNKWRIEWNQSYHRRVDYPKNILIEEIKSKNSFIIYENNI